MNQFRDITLVAFFALGVGLMMSDPVSWTWASYGRDYVGDWPVNVLMFLHQAYPFGSIICFAMSLALFMTRIKY